MFRYLLLSALLCLSASVIASAQEKGGKQTVKELIADLKKSEQDRTKALQALEALGPKAEAAVPALIELLPSKDEFTKLQATIVLGKIGKASVPPLTELLSAGDEDLRFYAVWGLAFVGPEAKSATTGVIKALTSDMSDQVRRKAAYALGRIDPEPKAAGAALIKALGDKDEGVRQAVVAALPTLGKAVVPALRKLLGTDKAALRTVAMQTLGAIGADAEPAIPDLKVLLVQTDNSETAADALAGIGAAAIPTLKDTAADENEKIRALSLRSLHKIGATAVPTLVDLLGAKHTDVRRNAAALLGALQVRDKSVVIALGFALKDKDYQVRRSALQALRGMGTGAQLAEPYVSALLVDIDPQLRHEAFQTLQGLGVDPRPGLKKALNNKDPAIRIPIASLMAALNFEVDLAEPVLSAGLKEKDNNLKMQAAAALSLRGLQADVVLPIFLEGLKSETASVRLQALEAIGRYGAKGRQAEGELVAALDDGDFNIRSQAFISLRQVAAPKTLFQAALKVLRQKDTKMHETAAQIFYQAGPDSVSDIVAMLKKENALGLRQVCLQALSMVGPPAKGAVSELIKALADGAMRNRMNAARALGNIGPDAKDALPALAEVEKADADTNVQQIARAAQVQIRADPQQKIFEVQGVLTAADPLDKGRPGSFHVVHTYRMKKGQSYTIDLTSPWDNYLRLENPQGTQVAFNDDSNGTLNAQIVYTAPDDGYYRIIVTSFGPRVTGNYTLKVR